VCLHSNQSHPHCVVNFEFEIAPLSYDLLASLCVEVCSLFLKPTVCRTSCDVITPHFFPDVPLMLL
jgi:hypothetical protein